MKEIYVFLTIFAVTLAEFFDKGGGRLLDPLGRSSLWRLNETSFPVNNDDHRLNCGGFEVQWIKNKGGCGICGDPFDGTHENGGILQSGFISKTFVQNHIINVTIETKEELYGYLEFRICPYTNGSIVTKDCLDNNILEIGDTEYTRYKVWHSGYHVVPLKLPEDLTCDACLLQLKYHTGYLWGCDEINCCYGCGPMQEEFYSCSDITITPDDSLKYTDLQSLNANTKNSPYMAWWCIFQCVGDECKTPECSEHEHLREKRQALTCKATGVWAGRTEMNDWCTRNCLSPYAYCPSTHCTCEDTTNAVPKTTTTTQATTTPGRLVITISPSEFTSVFGASPQIKCDIKGSPMALTWYWIRIPLTGTYTTIIYQGTNSADYTVENSASGPHLTIKNVNKDDEGDYMCFAVNAAGTTFSLKSRLYVVPATSPNIVRVMASAGCQYCNDKSNITCSSWYCPEEYRASLGLTGTLTDKVNKMADDFCAICPTNDTACLELFCLPNRRMVSLSIQARCNLCSLPGITCPHDTECSLSSSGIHSDPLSTSTMCTAVGDWQGQLGMDTWCQNNCPNPGSCPPTHCQCSAIPVSAGLEIQKITTLCTGAGPWKGSKSMADWCNLNCPAFCPETHCSCQLSQPTTTTTVKTTSTTTTTTTTTTRPTTTTVKTTKKEPLDTDLYSANAMNGIMCSICKTDPTYSACSNKYCEIYNPNLEEPLDSLNRVYTFSPAIFCQLAIKEGNTNWQSLFCGDIFAEVLPELQTVMCSACSEVGNGAGCESYCG